MTTAWDPRLYDDKHAFVWKHGAALLDLLQPRPGEQLLDLGCGTGQLTAQLAATGATVLGVDQSPEMIAEARRNFPALTFEIADARRLAFDAQFDGVFSNAVLHWIPEARLVVEGVVRALRPGGRFVAEFGGKGNIKTMLAAVREAAKAVGAGDVGSPWYFPSVAEYSGLLEEAGLEVTFAVLFDRPTPLDGEGGMRHWIEMFGQHFLSRVPTERREVFFHHVETLLRPSLHHDGCWHADYRRLRVVAWRTAR